MVMNYSKGVESVRTAVPKGRTYFGYLDRRVTFCLSARLAGTPKLGLAPLPNPLRVGHTTIVVG